MTRVIISTKNLNIYFGFLIILIFFLGASLTNPSIKPKTIPKKTNNTQPLNEIDMLYNKDWETCTAKSWSHSVVPKGCFKVENAGVYGRPEIKSSVASQGAIWL